MSTKETDWLSVGLNDRQVEESRARHGSNELTPPKRPSMWRLYLEKSLSTQPILITSAPRNI